MFAKDYNTARIWQGNNTMFSIHLNPMMAVRTVLNPQICQHCQGKHTRNLIILAQFVSVGQFPSSTTEFDFAFVRSYMPYIKCLHYYYYRKY